MGFVIQSYICFLSVIVRCERTIDFGSVLDGGAAESSAETAGSFLCDRYNGQNNLLAADDCLAQWPQKHSEVE